MTFTGETTFETFSGEFSDFCGDFNGISPKDY
jgi:hypothetical protein